MKIRGLVFCGMMAPLVYIAAVMLGGLLRPDYSHMSNFVSDLVASGAPHKDLLELLFGLYNILCGLFGFGVFMLARRALENRRRGIGMVGAVILLLEGLLGFAILFFPEDPVGLSMTSTGTIHIVLAGLSSLATMACMAVLGSWFRGERSLRALGLYSFISVGFVFLTGGFTAASAAVRSPILGLMERLTIGGFMQWLFVTGLHLYGARKTLPATDPEQRERGAAR
jgi:hypothetical membrane protein